MQGSKWHNEFQYFGYIWSSEWTTNKENIKKNGQLKSKSQNAHLGLYFFGRELRKKKFTLINFQKAFFDIFV